MATSLSQAMKGDETKILINSGFSSSISLKSYRFEVRVCEEIFAKCGFGGPGSARSA